MSAGLKNKIKFDDESTELFTRLRIPWKQSKEEIWVDVSKRIHSPKIIQLKPKMARWQMAISAIFILSLSLTVFMRTYSLKVNSYESKLVSTELPDGSLISLNANSTIKYHPFWWWANRSVELNGEAFFQVQKGKTFKVKSDIGTTEVLGTTFNVFARDQEYEVICITGKVKVQANLTKYTVILHPAQKASLLETGELEVQIDVNTENMKLRKADRLTFTSMPLIEVFNEIERQYQVDIILPSELSQRYTGNFDKPESVEKILQLVCRPFNLKVEKLNDRKFQILQ